MPLKLVRRPGTALWQITGTVAGQRVRESSGTTDRAIAEEIRAKRETDLHRAAIYGPAVVKTWGEAVLRYDEVKNPSAGQAAFLARITRYFGPRLLLKDIHQDLVDKVVKALCAENAAPATKLRNVIGPIRAVLTVAAARGWCALPALEVPKGATGEKRTRWLTPAELLRLRAASAPHLQALITFLVCTGPRLGEALRLEWADVDLPHARATLRGVKDNASEERDRILELPPAAVAALANIAYPSRDDEGKRIWSVEKKGRVFRTHEGEDYPDSEDGGGQIRTAWATACRNAGFPGEWHGEEGRRRWWTPKDVTPHVLRHTWASWRYAYHRDILRLKHEGDWSSISLVERYAKLVPAGLLPGICEVWGIPLPGTPLTQFSRDVA
nr:tyrosine-type recombinase/integrase [uncultured Roseococcus sp.]